MKRWAIRGGLAILVILAMTPWVVLESAMFSKFRRDFVSRALTHELETPVIIEGDVSLVALTTLRFSVQNARLPSTTMPDRNVAKLGEARFSVPLGAVLSGRFPLQDIVVRDLEAEYFRDPDGRSSWSKNSTLFTGTRDDGKPESNLLRVFYDKRIDIENIRLQATNEQTGFDFLFELKAFLLDYTGPEQPVSLTSHGTMNGQAFRVAGEFPRGQDFGIRATFGSQDVTITGAPYRDGVTDGFGARFDVSSPSLTNFFQLLALKSKMHGTGALSFVLDHRPGVIRVDDIDFAATARNGVSLAMSGVAENLISLDGILLSTDLRLVEDETAVPQAQELEDFAVLRVTADIIGEEGRFALTSVDAITNAFVTELKRIGPARVGKLFRADDGRLELTGIEVQSGPLDDPFLVAKGQVLDLLGPAMFRFSGTLNGDADLILPELSPEEVAALGGVGATFSFSDDNGVAALDYLNAQSAPSDLWSFKSSLRIADLAGFKGAILDVDLAIAEGATLMRALELTPVDTGPVSLNLQSESDGSDLTLNLEMDIDGTEVSVGLSHMETPRKNIVRGTLFSPEISFDMLDSLAAVGSEIATTGSDGKTDSNPPSLINDPRTPKPLVLAADGREIKPLVLKGVPAQTIVDTFLRQLDLEFGIKVNRLRGNSSFSGVDSKIVMNRGKLSAGPLSASVAGAHLTLNASADVILDPDTLHVEGTMGGLSLQRVLKMLRLDLDARGKISGNFGLAVNLGRDAPLLRRTTGWAQMNMSEGEVGTSLIDLAGLGVLPWIFSGRAGSGQSRIVCLVAPIAVNNGTFSSNQVVLETDAVQVILRGKLSVPANTIAIRGEPRPAGRPLARSAFPFEITGNLKKPDVAIARSGGESRERRGFRTVVQNHQPCRVYHDLAQ